MMRQQTFDGYHLTTIEQHGPFVGQDVGRLWIKHPTHGASRWTWYGGFVSASERQRALKQATWVTFAAWEAWWHAQP